MADKKQCLWLDTNVIISLFGEIKPRHWYTIITALEEVYTLRITDTVYKELLRGRYKRDALVEFLQGLHHIRPVDTQIGHSPTEYEAVHSGEKSIVETFERNHLVENGHLIASDDNIFCNGFLSEYNPSIVKTWQLVNRLLAEGGALTPEVYEVIRNNYIARSRFPEKASKNWFPPEQARRVYAGEEKTVFMGNIKTALGYLGMENRLTESHVGGVTVRLLPPETKLPGKSSRVSDALSAAMSTGSEQIITAKLGEAKKYVGLSARMQSDGRGR